MAKSKEAVQVMTKKPRKLGERKRVVISFAGEESRTKSNFKDECDINNIMARYRSTGQLTAMIRSNPMYGDFSDPLDYQRAHDLVLLAQQQFMALPAKVRERFGNDPQEFLKFASEPSNKKEMGELGLLKERAKEAPPDASGGAPTEGREKTQ